MGTSLLRSPNTTLQAAGGAINQTGGKLEVTGTLTSTSDTGTTFETALTTVLARLRSTNTTSGNVELTAFNGLLNVTAITNTGDNVTLVADDSTSNRRDFCGRKLATLAPVLNNRAVNIAGGAGGLNLTAAEVNPGFGSRSGNWRYSRLRR
ncbi:MAG: hypothetical protein IPK34_07095 [Ramlibacter sp.]|nr:hypothetical protein [Ramlibacter sp.]